MRRVFFLLFCLFCTGCMQETVQNRPEQHINKNMSPLDTAEEEASIAAMVEVMTIEELAGQLFIVAYRKDITGQPAVSMDARLESLLRDYGVGGVILFSDNIQSEIQLTEFIETMQMNAAVPLWIGIDEEGGRVSRLSGLPEAHVPKLPSAQSLGALSEAEIHLEASRLGTYLHGLGVNVNFAPIADMNTNPDNVVIGDRAFGSTPEEASKGVRAFVTGLEAENVAACLKHFPGHGDTLEDSHQEIALVLHDKARLSALEWVPFKEGIEAGATFVMLGHISAPNVTGTDETAVFSKEMVGILREDLGFSGIIITDAMDMQGAAKLHAADEAALKALVSGVDIILMPSDFEAAYAGVIEAVNQGVISREMIEEKVKRILLYKSRQTHEAFVVSQKS